MIPRGYFLSSMGAPILQEVSVDGSEPVTTAEAKAYARIDISDDDTLVDALVTTARVHCESFCRREFIGRTYKWFVEDWPYGDVLNIPRYPVNAVSSVTYYDTDSAQQTLSTSIYTLGKYGIPHQIWLLPDQDWPELDDDKRYPIEVNFTTSPTVPETVKTAIKLLVAHWYENREAVVVGSQVNTLPMAVENLLWAERIMEMEYVPVAKR